MIYRFGDFVLDTRRCELRRRGEPRHLEPQVYAVLCHLLAHRDRLVTRDELLDHVWGHRFVAPATLSSRIKTLRQALDDGGGPQRTIRTVRGRGFRFVADVRTPEEEPADFVRGAGEDDPRGDTVPSSGDGSSPAAVSPSSGDVGLRQEIRFCRAPDGVRIAYAASGSGPPLVKTANWLTHLEHDWTSPLWRHWMRELSRGQTLVRYDERGNGLSDWNVDDLSFDAWVSDLEAVVDALGVERVPLLGISQGAAVAVEYAARHPERVSRMVLYGGYARGRLRRDPGPEARREAETLESLLLLGWGRDNPAFRQVFATLFVPGAEPEQAEWLTELQRVCTTAENALRLERTSYGIDVSEAARRVGAPTLVLHAHGDAMIPFEEGRRLAALIPGARFVPLESRNHVLLEGEPAWERFLDEADAFLREDDAASARTPVAVPAAEAAGGGAR